jgi:hypothetical protein
VNSAPSSLPTKPINMKANGNNNNNYRRMLKKANDKRPKSGALEEQTQAASSASAIPRQAQARGVRGEQIAWTVVDTESMSTREKAKFKNQVPFSEEMYETIKACINILTDRTNRDNPQTPSIDEALWFRDAVGAIVEDAHKYVLCYTFFSVYGSLLAFSDTT